MIVAPNQTNSRSVLADWLEIQAIVRGSAGTADLRAAFGIEEDERGVESEDGDLVEVEIDERPLESNLDRVAEELGFRDERLAGNYPFQMTTTDDGAFLIRYQPQAGNPAHVTYVFQLFVSACRDRTISNSDEVTALVRQAEKLFHICASIGVAGLLEKGHTFWFGFPRPEGDGFLTALKRLCERLGFGVAKVSVPAGLPDRAKDDDVDVIGWRPFSDKRVGGLIVICQAASGADWVQKSILPSIQKFQDSWFEKKIYSYGVGAIAFPFLAHHFVELTSKNTEEDFSDACQNYFVRRHSEFGIMLDRIRITEATNDVVNSADVNERVEGIDGFQQLSVWTGELTGLID